jgi:3-methyladenine DNA glycosylase AlkD
MTPQQELRKYASKTRAAGAARFFKTGPGEYAEGDVFIGVTVPEVRKIALRFIDLPLKDVAKLLKSKIHEERLLALLVLAKRFPSAPETVYRFYMRHLKYVNNWDLVDASAPEICGPYLYAHPAERKSLETLATSHDLWRRRIAMVSMFYFIRRKRYREPLKVARLLLRDEHDLIHKAVGWMLRELGKRGDRAVLDAFLKEHATEMPRTALRYAIERHSPTERARWMACR